MKVSFLHFLAFVLIRVTPETLKEYATSRHKTPYFPWTRSPCQKTINDVMKLNLLLTSSTFGTRPAYLRAEGEKFIWTNNPAAHDIKPRIYARIGSPAKLRCSVLSINTTTYAADHTISANLYAAFVNTSGKYPRSYICRLSIEGRVLKPLYHWLCDISMIPKEAILFDLISSWELPTVHSFVMVTNISDNIFHTGYICEPKKGCDLSITKQFVYWINNPVVPANYSMAFFGNNDTQWGMKFSY